MQYDARIIRQFAEENYRSAATTEVVWPLVAGLLGAAFGWWITRGSGGDSQERVAVLVVGGICALIGFLAGRSRARILRLAAQLALCQANIEEHLHAMRPKAPAVEKGWKALQQQRASQGLFQQEQDEEG